MTATVESSDDDARQPRCILDRSDVLDAIRRVDDPEYPGVSIVDLGLLETIELEAGTVRVGLIPTFSGCPALAMIKEDVRSAVAQVPGVESVTVEWLKSPIWTVSRISDATRHVINNEFTVAIRIGTDPPKCPLCGAVTVEQSMFGPSRCRSVNRCEECSETIEVMRS